jgi:hypothetical protein
MLERLKRLPFVVKLIQVRHPSNSTCKICGLPWASCYSHTIIVKHCKDGVAGSGFFPVCEWCWNHKSKRENERAVIELFHTWHRTEYGSPYTLEQMIDAFKSDWELTHKED